MNIKLILFTVSTIVFLASVKAQNGTTKKADNQFDDYAFANAIKNYERLVSDGYSDDEIFKKLGDANYLNARYQDAAGWYSKLFMVGYDGVDSDYMYRYANSLKSTLEYEASDIWMQRYSETSAEEIRAQIFNENRDYLDQIEAQSGRYDLKTLSFNSDKSDFAPSFYGDQLIFSTARDSGGIAKRINEWDNTFFLNLFKTNTSTKGNFTTANSFSNGLNGKTHESSTAFTKDGEMVYFTRNNSTNGSLSRDINGVSRLKIYRARLKNGKWTDIEALPFNGDDYSCAHPTLSLKEDKLYFASDMPGTFGQSDIFVVDLNEDGSIGTPINLGDEINTEGRETFPFVSDSNVIYFSSDGRPGLGGLDVYATRLEDLKNPMIVNVGKPINGEDDDFSFIINEENGRGYFASNRNGGEGKDDIYGFIENEKIVFECQTEIAGVVNSQESGTPLAGVKMIMYSGNERVSETLSETDGSFTLKGSCKDGEYKVVATKIDYNVGNEMISVVDSKYTGVVNITLEKSLKEAAPGTDLVKFLNLRPVYYNLNEADFRPDASETLTAIIDYLRKFPDTKIEVRSYTDAKANDSYNKRLSQKRAKNTVKYLIANGVKKDVLSPIGLGKSNLLNDCTTRESCTDEKHQENRRSEFIVME